MTRALAWMLPLTSLACVPPPIEEPACTTWAGLRSRPIPMSSQAVDILVIVDGSSGSAGAQARLADGLDLLVAALEASPQPISYRIGVTTTDMGLPACDAALTTPERGSLIGSSCRERLADFEDPQAGDLSSLCTDACSLDTLDFLAQPWLDRDGGAAQLPEGVTAAEVLRCMAMVGTRSCAYEAPFAALEAVAQQDEFFRFASRHVYVIVSDADDCSISVAGEGMFDPAGTRVFWSDPLAEAPTPAVCWNAGTACEPVDGALDCRLENYTAQGEPNAPSFSMVLRDTQAIRDNLLSPYLDHWLLLGGIPSEGVDALTFSDQPPDYALEHGIGPGCDDQQGTRAIPPLRSLGALSFPDAIAGSICSADYSAEFTALGEQIVAAANEPVCGNRSPVCDLDPSTPMFDTDCWLYGLRPGELHVDVAECARGSDGAYLLDAVSGRPAMPAADVELCYVRQTDDAGYTADPLDDFDPACDRFDAAPLSFEIVTVDGNAPDYLFFTECSEMPEP